MSLLKKQSSLNQKNQSPTSFPYQNTTSFTNTANQLITQPAQVNYQQLAKNFKTLPQLEIDKIEKIKQQLPLPYESEDFAIDYSPLLNTFIISTKTSQGKKKALDWLKQNNLSSLLYYNNLVVFTNKPVQQTITESEYNYQKSQENQIQPTPTIPYPTLIMLSPYPTPLSKGIEGFFELLNIITRVNIIIEPTSKPSTPTTIQSPAPFYPLPPGSVTPTSLTEIFQEAGGKVGVPEKIIEGVMRIESPSTFYLTEAQIGQYSLPGNLILNCHPNACSATGPMQMTIGIDDHGDTTCPHCGAGYCPNAWASYGGGINLYGGYSHKPDPCNLRDNIYAATAKLKRDSGASDPLIWTQDQVYLAALRYFGKCDDAHRYSRLGNRTYCEYVWDYYQGLVN